MLIIISTDENEQTEEKQEDDVIELSLSELVGIDKDDNDTNRMTKVRKTYGLSLAYHRLTVLPYHIATDSLTSSITSLDLTDCKIQYLESLQNFGCLNVLILDHNNIEDISNCPSIKTLETLWCNNNRVSKLGPFLNNCADKFPRLKHLSIMRNPGVPDIPLIDNYNQDESEITETDTKLMMNADNNEIQDNDDILSDKADAKSDRRNVDSVDHKLDSDIKNDIYTEVCTNTIIENDDMNNDRTGEDYLLYRPAVYSILKDLESLDGIYFTAEEITMSSNAKVISWIATDDLDETENWTWPKGYIPPTELLRDKKKMKMIKHVQNLLDLRPICRDKAKLTFWNLDKRTITRYLEASLWKEDLNGTPVYQAIIDTINWRQHSGIPLKESDREWLSVALGKGFIVIPCAYDSFVYSDKVLGGNDTVNENNINSMITSTATQEDEDDDGDIGLELDCFLDTDSTKQLCSPTIDPKSRYRTKDGRPIIYIQFAHDQCTDGRMKGKVLIYSFERAIQLLPSNQTSFLVVIDMKGFGFNSAPAMKDLKEIGESLSKHMCCRLCKVYIVNVSFVTKMVYDTISSLFSEVTRAKFVFISDKNEIFNNLKELIDIDNIPAEYGGNSSDALKFDFTKYIECDPFINPTDERYKFFYS